MKCWSRFAAVLVSVGALSVVGSASALPILDQLLGGRPGANSSAATNVTSSSARLNGSVHPNGRGTEYFFEYGPTMAYGARTNEVSAGGGNSWKSVWATVSGLQASATYHFRLVSSNSRGTTRSDDLTFATAAVPPPGGAPPPEPDSGDDPEPDSGDESEPDSGDDSDSDDQGPDDSRKLIGGDESQGSVEPQLGTSVIVAPGDGEVSVRRPGRSAFTPLKYGSELPVGSEVDASHGSIALSSALRGGKTQTGTFGGGRFVIRQGRGGYVDLYLRGKACARRKAHGSLASASAARARPGRRLWGRDQGGRFRTHGKNSHATVRGTRWVVVDTCAGTLTRVSEGSVVVSDEVRRKRVVLKAGERYLARPRR